jgi:hypothetical protein
MGQAKQRGTFEQRKAEGIAKREEKELARRKAIAEAEAALTPEQRKKRKRAGMVLTSVLGMATASMQRQVDFARAVNTLSASNVELTGAARLYRAASSD